MRFTIHLLILILIFTTSISAADVPNIINFQGYLTNGETSVNGVQNITFALYDVPSEGTALWSETRDVDVNDGYYSILLGEVTPIEIAFSGDTWLGVQITGQSEMTPRYRIASMPYAYTAKLANSVIDNSIDSAKIEDGSISLFDIHGGNASPGQALKWSGAEWVPGDDEVGGAGPGEGWVDDGAVVRLNTSTDSVGIGTAIPKAELDVNGDVFIGNRVKVGSNHTLAADYSSITGGDSNLVGGDYTTIAGGFQNMDSASHSFIGGGLRNIITGDRASHVICGGIDNRIILGADSSSFIGGGEDNVIYGSNSTIGGGSTNMASGDYDFIGGGYWNQTTRTDTMYATICGGYRSMVQDTGGAVVGGRYNNAVKPYAFVGGGYYNEAFGSYSAVVGGDSNVVLGSYSANVGGQKNIDSTKYSFIGGGISNIIGSPTDSASVIVGGESNKILASTHSAIVGGYSNLNTGYYNFMGGGDSNSTAGGYGWSVICGGSDNVTQGDGAAIVGGADNKATTGFAFVGGGYLNTVDGNYSSIVGGSQNSLDSSAEYSFIGGGSNNTADSSNAAVVGGMVNSVSGDCSFIGGGYGNVVDAFYSSVSAGYQDTLYGNFSTIGGGYGNYMYSGYSVIGGGYSNESTIQMDAYCVIGGGRDNAVNGLFSVIPGGDSNYVSGDYALAAGRQANANHSNTFVWNGSSTGSFTSNDTGQFIINAPKGVGIGTNTIAASHLLHVNGLAKFNIGGGSIALSTPGGWPGFIAYSNGGDRRDIIYNDDGMHIVASTSSSMPGLTEGITILDGGNVGIKNSSPSTELDVNGNITCVSLTETSDIRFKKSISVINNALGDIMQIDGVKFEWDKESSGDKRFDDNRQIGLVAQDVEEIFPELVKTDNNGYKSVSYSKMTAVLLEAIKELKKENDDLKSRLEILEQNQ